MTMASLTLQVPCHLQPQAKRYIVDDLSTELIIPPKKICRRVSGSFDEWANLECLPDDAIHVILAYCTSIEICSVSGAAKRLRTAAEFVSRKIVKTSCQHIYQGIMSGEYRYGRSWSKLLMELEQRTEELFYFGLHDESMERASRFLRNGLGRGGYASFVSTRRSGLLHDGWGGLLEIVGGLTTKNCLFSRTDRCMASGRHKFLIRVHYPKGARARDDGFVGIVNEHFSSLSEKVRMSIHPCPNIYSRNCFFFKLPRVPESKGNEIVLGVTFCAKTKKLYLRHFIPFTSNDGHQNVSGGQPIEGPLFLGLLFKPPAGASYPPRYGASDVSIRECSKEEWDTFLKNSRANII